MKPQYWNHTGTYKAQWDDMTDRLVPASGNCDTVAGEVVRAVNKLYYDCFNNGFCNNTSGPIKFLQDFNRKYSKNADLAEVLDTIEPCTNTGGYSHLRDETVMDRMVDLIAEFLLANAHYEKVPNDADMYDFSDPDYYEEEEEDESEYEYDEEE